MMSFDFSTTVHGKWLLAGEHAVLRGCPSIVFPIKDKTLQLDYQQDTSPLEVDCESPNEDLMTKLLMEVLKKGYQYAQLPFETLKGQFKLVNNIPIGAGMGLSAALCAAASRWFSWAGIIKEHQIYEFAKKLEDLFHKQSSGVDIAGAISKTGILFDAKKGTQSPIAPTWEPHWYLSYSQKQGLTSKCVQKVKDLWHNDPRLAKAIDQNMNQSVKNAVEALAMPINNGLEQLANAINQARDCFTKWGLIPSQVDKHMKSLLSAGALAAKPTGSGGGGYVLSLWEKEPPTDIPFDLIKL